MKVKMKMKMKIKTEMLKRLKRYEYLPFEKIKSSSAFRAWHTERLEKEIYEALSDIRNMVASGSANIGTDAVITRLAERDGLLKNVYINMLSLMRTGRSKEAENVMIETVRTETGREFAALLMAWEYTSPEKLEEIIISHRQNIQETYITRRKRRDEIISDVLYFPATMNVFLIFINFIYISYFMQQKEMLSLLF